MILPGQVHNEGEAGVEPVFQVMDINPDLARYWLTLSDGNRSFRGNAIVRYAEDMKAGRWALTGDPIGFNTQGVLIQGHHRLRACVLSGVSFRSAVAIGLPDDAFMVMDSGVNRTPGDTLGLALSSRNATRIAALARVTYALRNGFVTDPKKTQSISRNALVELVRAEQSAFDEALELAWKAYPMLMLSGTGVVYMVTSERLAFASFIRSVGEGAGLSAGSPALALRNWAAGLPKKMGRDVLVHASAVIIAFNSHLAGQDRKLIKPWTPGSGRKFPELIR